MRLMALLSGLLALAFYSAMGAQTIFRPNMCGTWRWITCDASASFGLTPEEARQRVRSRMQAPELQPELVGIATDQSDEVLQREIWPQWDWDLQYMCHGSDEVLLCPDPSVVCGYVLRPCG